MSDIKLYDENRGAYLFSHFDSRGGSTLIVAKRLSQAATHYESAFGIDDSEDFPCDPAGADLVLCGQLWIEGDERPESGEELLPWMSGVDGWAVLRVKHVRHWRKLSDDKQERVMGERFEEEIGLLLVRDKVDRWNGDDEPAKLTRTWGREDLDTRIEWYEAEEDQDLGEDAFGVLFEVVS